MKKLFSLLWKILWLEVLCQQFARPNSDAAIGNFQDDAGGTTNIYQAIDEASASDTDYIRSPTSPSSEPYTCGLSTVSDPSLSTGHTIRMRTAADQDAQESIDFLQQLRQGFVSEGTPGTLIASQSRNGVTSTTWTQSNYTLSGAEADAITNYASLFLRFVVTVTP